MATRNVFVKMGLKDAFSNQFKKMGQSVDRFKKRVLSLNGAVAALGLGLGGGQVLKTADQFALLENRLKLVTISSENLAVMQKHLFEVSQDTRISYQKTIDLFTRMARSTKNLGISQRDLLDVTESINKALIVSGASATEANAAMVQLSQGLASGELRGEELRSVMEQTPRLAKAIADGIGTTIGGLRALSKEGKLTSERVFKAMLSQSKVIESEFSQMNATMGQGLAVLNNSLGRFISGTDKAGSVTSQLADGLIDVSQYMDQWVDSNEALIKQKVPEYTEKIKESLVDIKDLYQSLPEGVVGAAGAGIIGRMLFGGKAGTVIGGMTYLLPRIKNTIAGFQLADQGKLSWVEYATSNAEELSAALKRIAIEDMPKVAEQFEASGTFKDALAAHDRGDPMTPYQAAVKQELDAVRDSELDITGIKVIEAKKRKKIMNDSVQSIMKQAAREEDIARKTSEGIKAMDQQLAKDRLKIHMQRIQEEMKGMKRLKDFQESIARTMEDSFTDALMNIGKGFDNLREIAGNMLRGIAEEMARTFITRKAADTASTFLASAFSSMIASADGNVFNNRQLVPFAAGGIVSGPTILPLAGEAGPEAIMPLRRGPSGKLGVEALGASTSEIIINYNPVVSLPDRGAFMGMLSEHSRQIVGMVNEAMNKRGRPGPLGV